MKKVGVVAGFSLPDVAYVPPLKAGTRADSVRPPLDHV